MKEDLFKFWLRFLGLRTHYETDNHYNNLLKPIEDLIGNSIMFSHLLKDYFLDVFPTEDYIKVGIKKEEEMKKLNDLILNLDLSNESQTMVFHNFPIDKVYKHRIVSVSKFTLNRRSKLIYDFRSISTLYYDVLLPFHNKNYDPTSINCTSRSDLPSFLEYHDYENHKI